MPAKPSKLQIYMYDVFFGDCFLLVFGYSDGAEKFVLMDFGSTGKDKEGIDPDDELDQESTGNRLFRVAEHIAERCGDGGLDVVVATHRHKDHIAGFGLKKAGAIIMALNPKVVIQPWTEDPEDKRDLTKSKPSRGEQGFIDWEHSNFAETLRDMNDVAGSIETEILSLGNPKRYRKTIGKELQDRILFAARDNHIKNRAAVDNLQAMGPNHYVHYGYEGIDWKTILPGVNVRFLGPPTLEQSDQILAATNRSDEFWSMQAATKHFWGVQAATARSTTTVDGAPPAPIFGPGKAFNPDWVPPNARWFIRQLRSVRADQLLEIVRYVDHALNNTSVIMLFEVAGEAMLFPGDAQIENWQYAIGKAKEDRDLKSILSKTTVYKVGHHGSRNATPRSIWDAFKRKSTDEGDGRLRTFMSTMRGKHGESEDTAVPLPKMVTEMERMSEFHSTEDLHGEFFDLIEIDLAS